MVSRIRFTAETRDCRDAGGRVTQGAVTERAQRKKEVTAKTQGTQRQDPDKSNSRLRGNNVFNHIY
jgi:hypothetical protein